MKPADTRPPRDGMRWKPALAIVLFVVVLLMLGLWRH